MSLSISEWFGGDDGDEPRKVRSDGADLTIAERFGQEGAPPPDPRGCGQRGTAMTPEEWESTRARIRLPACEDCDDTGTITDPAPDAPGARPPEPCVSCPGRTLPVTPAERAAASMLRAWRDWKPDMTDRGPVHEMITRFGDAAMVAGLADAIDLTPAGRDLLVRVDASEQTTATVLRAKRDAWKALAIARGAILATQHATATPEIKPHLDAAYDALASFGVVPRDTYRPNAPPAEDP